MDGEPEEKPDEYGFYSWQVGGGGALWRKPGSFDWEAYKRKLAADPDRWSFDPEAYKRSAAVDPELGVKAGHGEPPPPESPQSSPEK